MASVIPRKTAAATILIAFAAQGIWSAATFRVSRQFGKEIPHVVDPNGMKERPVLNHANNKSSLFNMELSGYSPNGTVNNELVFIDKFVGGLEGYSDEFPPLIIPRGGDKPNSGDMFDDGKAELRRPYLFDWYWYYDYSDEDSSTTAKPDSSTTAKPDSPEKTDPPKQDPDTPSKKPDTPTTKPDTPTTKPDTPTSKPDTPTTKPDTPTSKPDTPTTKPDTPTTKPDTPTSKPDTPTSKPDTPTTKPDTPTSKPDTPTTKPDTPTTKPDTPATKPDTPTTKP